MNSKINCEKCGKIIEGVVYLTPLGNICGDCFRGKHYKKAAPLSKKVYNGGDEDVIGSSGSDQQ
jgi:hypothetical protein